MQPTIFVCEAKQQYNTCLISRFAGWTRLPEGDDTILLLASKRAVTRDRRLPVRSTLEPRTRASPKPLEQTWAEGVSVCVRA